MRVLVVHPGPAFSVADVYEGYANAFADLGCQVRGFNLDDRLQFYSNIELDGAVMELNDAITIVSKELQGKCYEFMPDLIVVISGFFIPGFTWDLWRARPHAIAVVMTESPYEDDKQVALVERAQPTLTIVNDPINLDRYREVNARTYYIPHSYDPAVHCPDPFATREHDFSFVGTGYPSRIEFFEQVDWTGVNDIAFAGHWKGLSGSVMPDELASASPLYKFLVHDVEDCYSNSDTAVLYQHSKISANLYRAGRRPEIEANSPELAHGWAMGPREVELAATGTFFLREPRGEGDLLLNMLPTFTEPGEFGEQLRWWLHHDDEREEAASRAQAAVVDRTFTNHARRLLALLP